ncbi:MAG TPA: selenocysteine-specific translation elongation factor [Blastocatellia bacterium]|nr:selenocysteine-specific translation elongation factor [Blastocatellia bacterium]HMV83775.1 selenocysteine-specific translation elongation factor [Blastocatellia bacterium]HMY74809.1 selenocysteine-specific translation elongation factor [Blastocatellia bacterium]HNG31235.1 selenocysteine-specific translation elongation factor [Blastocatellia bacterium]
MKRIIVGTAGHIDHGKTSLVRALTGVDADRLKEEKERGITIDIGFADLTVGDVHFGFVDVPGHERFVKNMLAGAHGMDLVMLTVAADEGVMPQTREHFDICRLLEIKAGLIVLTKIDMVDAEFADLVEADVADYVAGSFLESAPILRVSSRTGEGIDELKKALAALAKKVEARDERAVARLPVDRVFTIKGFGTVVTGTLVAGRIALGDELELLPSANRRARVRGLQVHGHVTQEAKAGERTAVNLQGIELDEVARGQALAPAGRLVAASMLDVKLRLLKSAPRPLRTRSRVRLHIGTAEALARVVLLGQSELAPGADCFAQLRLESPVPALPKDHFIVRSYSPMVTIGGGVIVDALPRKHRVREGAQAAAQLEKLAAADDVEQIALLAEMAGEQGMSFTALAARSGLPDDAIKRAADSLTKSRRLAAVTANPLLLLARTQFDELAKQTRALLKAFHSRAPLESGMPREELREKIFSQLPPEIFRAVLAQLAERNEVIAEKDLLRLSSHRVALSAEEQAAKDHLAEVYARAGLQPLSLEEAIAQAGSQFGIDAARATRFAQMLVNSGELVKVADLVFHRSAIESARALLQQHKAAHGARLEVGAFKDLTGISRKYAIPLLEYFDRQRITRRVGEAREIL